jgi:benzoate-CoA ligase
MTALLNATTAILDRNLEAGRGDRTGVVHGERRLSFAALADLANRAGNALRDLGVAMEQRVAILLPDCPEFLAAFFGAIKLGAVAVPLNTMLTPRDYAYLLNDSRAAVLVTHPTLLDAVAPALAECPRLRHVVLVDGEREGTLAWTALVGAASPRLDPADTTADDPAFWLYSSGSTGPPKGAVHLQHDMIYAATHVSAAMRLGGDDVLYSAPKLFFAYGLGNSLFLPCWLGATVVLVPERPLPATVFETLHRHRPTVFFGVPTLFASMLQAPDAGRYDLSSLRYSVSGGETLPPAIFHEWRSRFGHDIVEIFGSSEILHICLANPLDACRPGSSGRVIPGYEARVVDEAGRDVPDGEIGNLLIKGDSIAACYWNKHERSKRTFLGEWVFTGDKYTRDADGYFWFNGRSDDMFKVGGIWVSPIEVEHAVASHPAVLEAAVVAQPDEHDLIKPKAFVVLREGHAPSPALAADIQRFVKEQIAPYKYPRWVEFVPSLPKTATGKIRRFQLRDSKETR